MAFLTNACACLKLQEGKTRAFAGNGLLCHLSLSKGLGFYGCNTQPLAHSV